LFTADITTIKQQSFWKGQYGEGGKRRRNFTYRRNSSLRFVGRTLP
jgi:hypothetical protein